jgi:hypothetical protein
MLHNPADAGCYAYGRRSLQPSRRQPGRPNSGRRRGHDLDDGVIVLRDRLPAYISWDRYMANREKITANRSEHLNVPRHGPGLLSGLLVCGRCGHRMLVTYNNNGGGLRYFCGIDYGCYGTPVCQSLAGRVLDAHITGLVLQAMKPSALETSLQLAEDLELERAERHQQWKLRLERARYEAERARRQYAAVEPENRLVARTLERQWEEALAAEQRLKTEYERCRDREPIRLTPAEREAVRHLAEDVPALWGAPTTTMADRQELIRLMLERVVVTVVGTTEAVTVECHWAGGTRTRTDLRRPVARLAQLSNYEALLGRVADLHRSGRTRRAIADTLNAEGWHPAKRRPTFTPAMVGSLLGRQGLASRQRLARAERADRHAGELTIPELVLRLDMPEPTVFSWLRRGILRGRQTTVSGHRIWLIEADDAEIARLKELRELPLRERRALLHP